jgi:hypothetical protein
VMASRVDTPCCRVSAWTDTGIVFLKPLGSTTDRWASAVRPWAIEVAPRQTIVWTVQVSTKKYESRVGNHAWLGRQSLDQRFSLRCSTTNVR